MSFINDRCVKFGCFKNYLKQLLNELSKHFDEMIKAGNVFRRGLRSVVFFLKMRACLKKKLSLYQLQIMMN